MAGLIIAACSNADAEDAYGSYFTESGLDFFMAAFATQYPAYAYNAGYKLSLKGVTIEENEKDLNLYTFNAKVGFQKSGEEEKTANVKGKVFFSAKEEGKIGKFEYGNDEGLSDKLGEKKFNNDFTSLIGAKVEIPAAILVAFLLLNGAGVRPSLGRII